MATYHVELRDFPRSYTRFNLTGPEVGTIALIWVQDQVLTTDDEEWSPRDAHIRIVEGPEIPIGRLTMGRGWTIAQAEGEDVTDRVLAEAREALRHPPAAAPTPDLPEPVQSTPPVDSLTLAVELAGLLGPDAGRLLAGWRAVAARSSGLAPSESLALAERELAGGSGPGK